MVRVKIDVIRSSLLSVNIFIQYMKKLVNFLVDRSIYSNTNVASSRKGQD